MKIIELRSENLKRLQAVEIRPDSNLVQITGKNGQGKSSVLDSIWYALAGAKTLPGQPIRRGANQAVIKLDMGEIVVKRTFRREPEGEGFTTKLEVVGNVRGTPQQMLDSLLDSLAFDPLEFARMDPRKQADLLKKYVPDFDFTKMAAENSIDFSKRTEVNRKAKELRIQADQILITDEMPTVRIDDAALVSELAEAGKKNADTQLREKNRETMRTAIESRRATADALMVQVTQLKAQILELETKANGLYAQANTDDEKLKSAPALPALIEVSEIQKRIADAKKVNEQVDRRDRKSKLEQDAITAESEAKQLTARMELRDQKKIEAISRAALPVEGLAFDDDQIFYKGVPFDQASDAEKLRVSTAIAMAGNPELRVIRIRDGSLLDEESLALIAHMADEKDYQVWIELIRSSDKTAIVIENGAVKEANAVRN